MMNIYRQNLFKSLGAIPKRCNYSKHVFWCNFKFQISNIIFLKKNFYIVAFGNRLHDVVINYIDSKT